MLYPLSAVCARTPRDTAPGPDAVRTTATSHRKVRVRDAAEREQLADHGGNGGGSVRDGAERASQFHESRGSRRCEQIVRVTGRNERLDRVAERVDDYAGGSGDSELGKHLVLTLDKRFRQDGHTIDP